MPKNNLFKDIQFTNLMFNVMKIDSHTSSRAISINVSAPKEIDDLFESITYSKVYIRNYYCGRSRVL